MTNNRNPRERAPAHGIPPAQQRLLFPLSTAQERCWFIDRMNPGNPALNVVVCWEIRGHSNPSNIEQAFRHVIDRHEILRTRFVEVDGEPMQEVVEWSDFRLSVIDLTMLPEGRREEQAIAIGRQESIAAFDLTTAALIRATLLKTDDERGFLVITAHQSVFDGWSIGILGREVGLCAAALDANREPELPELPLQYGDYALWQKEYLASGGIEAEKKFWKKRLEGAPYFEVAPDHPHPPHRANRGGTVAATLGQTLSAKFDATAKRLAISPFNLGCASVAALLHRYTGAEDLVLGTQVAGRHDVDLEGLIGVFINNLVLRFGADGSLTFAEFTGRIGETIREALINQHVPFHQLVGLINPARDVRRTPLISTNVIVQHAFMEDAQYGEFRLGSLPSWSPGAFYDLNFQMIGRKSGWRLSIEYNADLFDKSTMQKLLSLWEQVLGAVLQNPDAKLSDLIDHTRHDHSVLLSRNSSPRVERFLSQHPDVGDAVVVSRTGSDGREHVYGYITPSPTTSETLESLPGKLLAALVSGLGDCGKLAGISVLRALPRLADGQVDRSGLLQRIQLRTPDTVDASDIDARLMAIWRENLGTEAIAPNSNYFALGGHSLLALRMLSRVRTVFGIDVDIAALFQAPIFGEFAAKLGGSQRPSKSPQIIVVQPKGDLTPVIAINDTYMLFALSRHFGEERRCVGVTTFDPQHLGELPDRPFEEIAADYLPLIKSVQPRGPYVLFGLCVHGVLAVEIARQLRAQGDKVAKVAAINCWAPQYAAKLPFISQCVLRVHSVRTNLARVFQGRASFAQFLATYTLVRRSRILDLAVRLSIIKKVPPQIDAGDAHWFLSHLARARKDYQLESFAGNLLLFSGPTVPTGRLFDPMLGWGRIVKGFCQVHSIATIEDGQQLQAIDSPGTTMIAERLRPLLMEMDAAGSKS